MTGTHPTNPWDSYDADCFVVTYADGRLTAFDDRAEAERFARTVTGTMIPAIEIIGGCPTTDLGPRIIGHADGSIFLRPCVRPKV